jgi:hypothetical protein
MGEQRFATPAHTTGRNDMDARVERSHRTPATGSRRSVLSGVAVALLSFIVSPARHPKAIAQTRDETEICRLADEEGLLEQFGLTRGDCVNYRKGPSSKQARNFVAGFCGIDRAQEIAGVTNKGACIKVMSNPD